MSRNPETSKSLKEGMRNLQVEFKENWQRVLLLALTVHTLSESKDWISAQLAAFIDFANGEPIQALVESNIKVVPNIVFQKSTDGLLVYVNGRKFTKQDYPSKNGVFFSEQGQEFVIFGFNGVEELMNAGIFEFYCPVQQDGSASGSQAFDSSVQLSGPFECNLELDPDVAWSGPAAGTLAIQSSPGVMYPVIETDDGRSEVLVFTQLNQGGLPGINPDYFTKPVMEFTQE